MAFEKFIKRSASNDVQYVGVSKASGKNQARFYLAKDLTDWLLSFGVKRVDLFYDKDTRRGGIAPTEEGGFIIGRPKNDSRVSVYCTGFIAHVGNIDKGRYLATANKETNMIEILFNNPLPRSGKHLHLVKE